MKNMLFGATYFTPAIFLIDSYKLPHKDMYPDDMELLFSTWTPRSAKIAVQAGRQLPRQKSEVVFFGVSMAIQRMVNAFTAWFAMDEDAAVEQYVSFIKAFLKIDMNADHVRELHRYQRLPLRVFALPEGTVTNVGVCQLVVFNIGGKKFAWFTNYIESLFSNLTWKPATSATIARNYYLIADYFAGLTCEDGDGPHVHLEWQQHDFAFRGLSGVEDAESSSVGHLLFFSGTDCIPSLFAAAALYNNFHTENYGSVPASEHSVTCTTATVIETAFINRGEYKYRSALDWAIEFGVDKDDAFQTAKQLAELISIAEALDANPEGILSWVSDTWDFWYVLTAILPRLRDKIMARNGKLVIRPDSGDPIKIICGDKEAPEYSPAYWGAIKILGDVFGYRINSKGFRELDSHIGLIYGDSITLERAEAIYAGLARNEWASNNVVLGIGSYTYQATTRDVWGFAMKATACVVGGVEMPVFKDPKTDDGVKKSFKGFLTTRFIDGEYKTIDGLSFAEATDLTNSAFIEYPLDMEAYDEGSTFNDWPTIKARAMATVTTYRPAIAA